VMIDVDGDVTNRLLRASQYIKDNRIPPAGFVSTHPSYDTTAIFGNATVDPNFNRENGIEGSGSDIITYRIPASANTNYTITAEVCFQSIKPKVVEYIAGINEPDINKFVTMYNQLPNLPFKMKSVTKSIVTDVENDFNTANNFLLEQNYPNPFNPTTKIKFTIPSVGSELAQTTLKLFDVLGNEVTTLVNEEKTSGYYEITFDAGQLNISSGVYFYKLQAGQYSAVKKLVLMK
ncbi:MAG: T9SS type A sorting domain-containing protein, partial [Ignavibacterium sp.]